MTIGVVLFKGYLRNNGSYRYDKVGILNQNNWRQEIANYQKELDTINDVTSVKSDETFVSFGIHGNRYMIAAAPVK